MDSIAKILRTKNKNTPLMKGITAGLVLEYFQKILIDQLGEQAVGQIQAISLKNKMLTIACLNSSAASEVRLREDQLLSLINEKFGNDTVNSFKFML